MAAVGVFDEMRREHERLLALVAALERRLDGTGADAPDADGVRAAAEGLADGFGVHVRLEDDVLFPALVRALPGTLVRFAPFAAEHRELQGMLAALVALAAAPSPERDEQLAVQVEDVVELMRIHLRKEEAVVFRVAERVLEPDALESLATRLASNRRTHPPAPPAGA